MHVKEIFDLVAERFGAEAVFDLHEDPKKDKDAWFTVAPASVEAVCRLCRDEPRLAMNFLECLTGVDLPSKEQIAVVYHLYSYEHRHRIVMKAFLPRQDPRVATVSGVWPVANWQERECYDLLGVVFEGHPDLRRILLPDDWQGYPLRKDYKEGADYHGIPTTRQSPFELLKLAKAPNAS
jgi:NADH-quinone oxidoreductase subunit C